MTHEKRHFHRFPRVGRVIIEHEGARHETELVDLSLKGILAAQPQGWTPNSGEPCQIEMQLENVDTPLFMEAAVAHCDHQRIGFRCLHIDLDSITFLKRLVELNLGDPALLERELSSLG
jgi:hypothetical protein